MIRVPIQIEKIYKVNLALVKILLFNYFQQFFRNKKTGEIVGMNYVFIRLSKILLHPIHILVG